MLRIVPPDQQFARDSLKLSDMRCGVREIFLFVCAVALYGQAQTPQPQAGLETDWDIAAVLQRIGDHGGRLLQALDKVDAKNWVAQGASETYEEQLQSSKDQARALTIDSKALARNPEKLSAGLQLYFRVQGLNTMLGSLEEGMRKYQSSDGAEALTRVAAEGSADRERLQQYLVSLSQEQEQQLQVMDKEAQRCRALLAAPPQTSKRKK